MGALYLAEDARLRRRVAKSICSLGFLQVLTACWKGIICGLAHRLVFFEGLRFTIDLFSAGV
jgi:hypothetical protein